jgi:catechol 2,3-dioxygenase-like lactoylglutathione lyase family enzyme
MPAVRYLVSDVDAAVEFWTQRLGFELEARYGPPFAIVRRDGLTVWLSGPGSSAARPMPDGSRPAPGGWNRIVLEVEAIETLLAELRAAGVRFRSELVRGPGGAQVVLEDPDGNPVELFEPR